jgi:hypothetical protein
MPMIQKIAVRWMQKQAYEQFVDEDGYVWDDEGNRSDSPVGKSWGRNVTYGLHDGPSSGGYYRHKYPVKPKAVRVVSNLTPEQTAALNELLAKKPNDSFIASVVSQAKLKGLSEKQLTAIQKTMRYLGMHNQAKLFDTSKPEPAPKPPVPNPITTREMFELTPERLTALDALLTAKPNDGFVKSLVQQAKAGRGLSEKQLTALRRFFHMLKMENEAKLFKFNT